ncbi:cytoskeletal protein RodZ [Sphingobium boeckii]|uniref:Cytoskeletal protein RodZ n=2 Tax=Sphingobium boeckii TaxID=1082345 RepID=A0A7W9AED0_9SPHN|nr:cytoskeletal protein RodZ [Sphingobium boeckii]
MFPKSVGERLAEARKKAKIDLADVSSRTRIPLRHLEAIETGRYADLPSATYATGFTKAYARTLGMDEVEIGRDVRAELQAIGAGYSQPDYFEPADPARVPPRALAWTAALVAILIIGGFALWRSGVIDGLGGRDPAAIAAGTDVTEQGGPASEATINLAAPAATPAAPPSGQVVLTANDEVWVRIYDAANQRLLESTMKPGDRFEVPADANNPQINVGRPEALTVTVGGQPVPALGIPGRPIRDVGVSAAALAARPAPAPDPSAPPTAATVTPAAAAPAASNAATPAGQP